MLALLTIASDEHGYLFIALMLLLCLYFGIHLIVKPFKYTRVNRIEAVCIFTLIVVLGFVNGTGFGTGNDELTETILASFLLVIMSIPLLAAFYEVARICKHSSTTEIWIAKERFEKIQNRKTTANSSAGKTVEMTQGSTEEKTATLEMAVHSESDSEANPNRNPNETMAGQVREVTDLSA